MVTDFDDLNLPDGSFDAIYAFESIGYSKDVDAWLARCWRMLKPGGRLLIRSPGSLDFCRREKDYQSVTAFFENWRYNFLGANVLVFKLRRLGFDPIRYRHLPFWAWGLTWNFIQHLFLVEVSAADAHHGGARTNHLADIQGLRVRQRVQHRVGHQAAAVVFGCTGGCRKCPPIGGRLTPVRPYSYTVPARAAKIEAACPGRSAAAQTLVCAAALQNRDRYANRLCNGPGAAVHRFARARAAPHPGHAATSFAPLTLAGDQRPRIRLGSHVARPGHATISASSAMRANVNGSRRGKCRRSRRCE